MKAVYMPDARLQRTREGYQMRDQAHIPHGSGGVVKDLALAVLTDLLLLLALGLLVLWSWEMP